MSVRSALGAAARHSMRAYYIAVAGGALLIVSACLPWIHVGDATLGGVPDLAGLWILALGALAVLLASLSIVTRRNSRHPLLLVGLVALAIMIAGQRLMTRSASNRAWAATQARAIVLGVEAQAPPRTTTALGVYLGLGAATLLVLFGLTIVVKRVARPYAAPADDDI
jgi:hypothetical protein